jgi:hypothetical protein
MKPVSVVMSVYNEPLDWLVTSIDSIRAQTFTAFEFIIINDNPGRQELKSLLNDYGRRDDRIYILKNDENLGLAKSLNKGLKRAQGKYIARMDADDRSLPQRFQWQYDYLEHNPDVFILGCSVQIMDRNGQLKEKVIKHRNHQDIVNDLLSRKLAFYHPAIMFRNNAVLYRDKLNGAEDYDLYLNGLSQGRKLGGIQKIGLHYRMSGQGVSMTQKRKQIILSHLALKFYHERRQKGSDTYEQIDFNNEAQLLNLIGLSLEDLEAQSFRDQTVFALGIGDLDAARYAFQSYTQCRGHRTEKLLLWLFLSCPRLHSWYRKLRYEIFRL